MSQMTMEQLQQAFDGLNLNTINQKEYEGMKELARGPGTSCYLRYNDKKPDSKKVVCKFADFRNDEESNNIRNEAEFAVPLINREKYTQKIIDYKVSRNSFQAIYEYIEGEDLYQYVERRKAESNPIAYEEAAALVMEVWEILKPLHARKVCHRNIKLGNIIRRKQDGRLFLGDFSFGNILLGKMHFGIQFTDKMGLHNLCLEPDAGNDSTLPLKLDGYSMVMLFCQLLGKKMSLGQFSKQNPTNFIKMEGVFPPVPSFIVDSVKYLSIGDSYGNRQPLSEALRFFSQWSNKNFEAQQQIDFEYIQEIQNQAQAEIDYQKVVMIHPCCKITDAQFYNYMICLTNKKKQAYEKINLHFGYRFSQKIKGILMIKIYFNKSKRK